MKYRMIASLSATALFSQLFACSGEAQDTGAIEEDSEATEIVGGGPSHCAVQARALLEDGTATEQAVAEPQCFRTFAESIRFASDGRVDLAGDAPEKDLDEALQKAELAAPAVRYVLSVETKDRNHQGSSLTVYGGTTCTAAPGGFDLDSMPRGWDNVISSSRAYSGCRHVYHYDLTNQRGVVLDTRGSSGAMGAMNDRTSSLRHTR